MVAHYNHTIRQAKFFHVDCQTTLFVRRYAFRKFIVSSFAMVFDSCPESHKLPIRFRTGKETRLLPKATRKVPAGLSTYLGLVSSKAGGDQPILSSGRRPCDR